MPHHELKNLPDGKIEVKLETGEVFTGDPLEVTAKLADSKVETRRHYEQKETELTERYRQQQTVTPPAPVVPPTPQAQQEAELQKYLLDQQGKALGFDNGEQYKAHLERVSKVATEVENQAVAANFLSQCPDFPNSPEAIEALSKKIDSNPNWGYTPQSMIAAHALCVREGTYKALTPEEINAGWANQMAAANRPKAPPMIQGGSPENRGNEPNPWEMKLDDLRKAALAQGKA